MSDSSRPVMWWLRARRLLAAFAGAAMSAAVAVGAEREALADEVSAAPTLGSDRVDASAHPLPAPFVVPELSGPRLDARVDWMLGRVTSDAPPGRAAVAALVRPSAEVRVFAPHRLFVGLACPLAAALPPDGGLARAEAAPRSGTRVLVGNVEAHVRALFPLPDEAAIGFTLGLVLPTAAFDRSARAARSASEAAASLEPTSYVHFRPGRFALRPAGDLRVLRGPFVLQGRHGVDVVVDTAGSERVKLAGRLLGHVGLLVRPDLEVSLEATQVYFFSSDEKVAGEPTPSKVFADDYRVSDEHRSAFTIGPGVRVASRDVDVGVAIVTNLSSPLSPAADGFVGVNVSLIAHVAPEAR